MYNNCCGNRCSCYNKQNSPKTAFGRIKAGKPNKNINLLDKTVSNAYICKVENIGLGRYKIYFDECFCNRCDDRKPVIQVTPCESLTVEDREYVDKNGNNVTISEIILSEQAVVLCDNVTCTSAIVTTGRRFTFTNPQDNDNLLIPEIESDEIQEASFFVPVASNDVDFYFTAYLA